MSGLTATSVCMYVTKIVEASTHLRCAHTWGDADPQSTEYWQRFSALCSCS